MTASRTLALAISAVLCASITTAHGAEGDAGGRTIEEVIVSVERVEQTLQSYEGTAVAMSQAALDTLGANDLLDLPALMPGLSFSWPRHSTQLALNRNDRDYDALFAYGFGLTYRDRDQLGPL